MVFYYVSLWDLHKSLKDTTNSGLRPTHKRTHLEVILPYLVVTRKNQLRLMKVGRLVIPHLQLTTQQTHIQVILELHHHLQPSMSPMSQDLCVVGISGGVSTFGVGVSGGTYRTDENCERIKLSKVLNDRNEDTVFQYFVKTLECSLQWNKSGTPWPI